MHKGLFDLTKVVLGLLKIKILHLDLKAASELLCLNPGRADHGSLPHQAADFYMFVLCPSFLLSGAVTTCEVKGFLQPCCYKETTGVCLLFTLAFQVLIQRVRRSPSLP